LESFEATGNHLTKPHTLESAYQLREEGRFREAYEEFCLIAKTTDNVVLKAGIILNAATALTALHEFDTSRRQLAYVRDLIAVPPQATLSVSEQDEVLRLKMDVEIEEAQILSEEGRIPESIDKFGKILEEHQLELKTPKFIEEYDVIQSRRAFLWTDIGRFKEALPLLEEIESRQTQNAIFHFYLGHCYAVTEDYDRALERLEKSIRLGLPCDFDFQAHCSLGMALYGKHEYARAKIEFEMGIKTATPRYILEAQIWKWLEYCCKGLGLEEEANTYALLRKSS
jgi:tetratricopeptide (TPR) repeat protein